MLFSLDETTKSNKLIKQSKPIKIKRGVRRGHVISSKLFNQALEDVFEKLEWKKLGINFDGVHVNHLRYADGFVLITDKREKLQRTIYY